MMSGSKRNLREKITLLILFLISLPFVLVGALLFIIIYLLIAPTEILFYKRSYYYKDLKEKYYLLITFNKNYKKYNKIIKSNSKTINLIYIKKESDLSQLNNKMIKYLNNYIVINKKYYDKSVISKTIKKEDIIIYED